MGPWQLVAVVGVAGVVVAVAYLALAQDWLAQSLREAAHRRVTYLVAVPALLAMFLLGVPYVYLEAVTDPPPPPLSFADLQMDTSTTAAPSSTTVAVAPATTPLPGEVADTTTTTAAATTSTTAPSELAGAWTVGRGSQARYAIDDTILGQTQRVVGSTDRVTGTMSAAGTAVTATSITVDMRSVRCGCSHDDKYQDLLDTDRYPTSTFVLGAPIELGPTLPAEGVVVDVPVTGSFTIHGTTRTVRFTLHALRRGGRIAVNGVIPVRLGNYGIESPSAGAMGGISNPAIELLVAFDRA